MSYKKRRIYLGRRALTFFGEQENFAIFDGSSVKAHNIRFMCKKAFAGRATIHKGTAFLLKAFFNQGKANSIVALVPSYGVKTCIETSTKGAAPGAFCYGVRVKGIWQCPDIVKQKNSSLIDRIKPSIIFLISGKNHVSQSLDARNEILNFD